MNEILIEILCVLGSLAVLLAALGLVRFPDFFSRTHAATKASAFGVAVFFIAVCIAFPHLNMVLKSIFAMLALFLTLPVASQALAEAILNSDSTATRPPGFKDPAGKRGPPTGD